MRKFLSLTFLISVVLTGEAMAQVAGGDSATTKAIVTKRKFILSDISSIGVDTFNASGATMKGQRHEIGAQYQVVPDCPSDGSVMCVAVMPAPPRQMTILFREWEVANTPIKARIFNICRRSIERAQPGSRIMIQGRSVEDAVGNRVVVKTITSCSVGSGPE